MVFVILMVVMARLAEGSTGRCLLKGTKRKFVSTHDLSFIMYVSLGSF
jgi:hypothetical protein